MLCIYILFKSILWIWRFIDQKLLSPIPRDCIRLDKIPPDCTRLCKIPPDSPRCKLQAIVSSETALKVTSKRTQFRECFVICVFNSHLMGCKWYICRKLIISITINIGLHPLSEKNPEVICLFLCQQAACF